MDVRSPIPGRNTYKFLKKSRVVYPAFDILINLLSNLPVPDKA